MYDKTDKCEGKKKAQHSKFRAVNVGWLKVLYVKLIKQPDFIP
jgi:hypothetical protein